MKFHKNFCLVYERREHTQKHWKYWMDFCANYEWQYAAVAVATEAAAKNEKVATEWLLDMF